MWRFSSTDAVFIAVGGEGLLSELLAAVLTVGCAHCGHTSLPFLLLETIVVGSKML